MTSSSRRVVLPGSFDPVTLGHTDILARAAALYERVIVAVLVNAEKRPMFTATERVGMLRGAAEERRLANVEVEAFDGLLVDFAAARGAGAIVRGLRSATDLDYERQLAGMNRHLNREIETVFLTSSSACSHISSRLVRDVIAHGGSVDGLVPASVLDLVARRRRAATTRQA
jgi:pantetheine-phosphate adenylyltransferase